MTDVMRIGLVGDYSASVKAHVAIPRAVALASADLQQQVETHWLATPLLEHDTEQVLSAYQGLWCVPASPYESMEGALNAIRFAREHKAPFLGTCCGSQPTLISHTRN